MVMGDWGTVIADHPGSWLLRPVETLVLRGGEQTPDASAQATAIRLGNRKSALVEPQWMRGRYLDELVAGFPVVALGLGQAHLLSQVGLEGLAPVR
jgi:hypothetical protein